MARTRALDFEDRQKDILRAAAVLFAERGYSETLLEDIAEKCGIGKSSLYHYHRSKHAILHSLITWKIEDLAWKVEAAVEQSPDARSKLRALVHTLIKEYIRVPEEVTVLLTQTRHLNKTAQRTTAQIQNRIINRAVLLLLEIRPDAEIPRRKSTALAMLFFGMVNWVHVWYKPSGSIKPDDLTTLIVDTFLDGFTNQPAERLS